MVVIDTEAVAGRLALPLGSLAVTLTATSFTWRQHVTVLRAAGKELSVLNPQDYPGARALTEHVRVPALPTRPTVLEVTQDLPVSTRDGCISDFVNPAVVRNRSQSRAVALALGLEEGQALLIQGPPGTGKSTTAAEIDIQLVLRDPGVRDAWARGQGLAIHGWVYALRDGLLQDLGMCVTKETELTACFETAREGVSRRTKRCT